MSQRLGKVRLKVAGALVDSMPGATLDLGGNTRNPVIGGNKVLGYAETPKEARVEFQVSVARGTSLQAFDTTDATITFESDTGQVWSLANAWLVEPPKLTASEGGPVQLVYAAERAEEIV